MRSYIYVLLLCLGFVPFAKADAISAQVHYGQGKSYFLVGKDKEAIDSLSLVPFSDQVYGLRSQYILGASYSRLKEWDKAHACFSRIVQKKVKSILDRNVRDLAILGNARLYYEQNNMREAVLAYQQLGLDSSYASLMLYELTKTYVRYGDWMYSEPVQARLLYESAARTLGQLLILNKSVLQDPRARLLVADLSMRLGDMKRATLLYDGLFNVFEQTRQALLETSKKAGAFAEMLLAKENDPDVKRVYSWFYSQDSVRKSLTRLQEIKKMKDKTVDIRDRYETFLRSLSLGGESESIIEKARTQIQTLTQSQARLESMEKEFQILFADLIKERAPKWLEEANWLLAGADSGMLQGVLKEQHLQNEKIKQIEMIKVKELSQINQQFEMSHGGSL